MQTHLNSIAKTAKKSANVGARRTRTGSISLPHAWIHARQSEDLSGITSNIRQQKTCFLLTDMNLISIWAAIHSAVHVFTGEADEIAALLIAVFA